MVPTGNQRQKRLVRKLTPVGVSDRKAVAHGRRINTGQRAGVSDRKEETFSLRWKGQARRVVRESQRFSTTRVAAPRQPRPQAIDEENGPVEQQTPRRCRIRHHKRKPQVYVDRQGHPKRHLDMQERPRVLDQCGPQMEQLDRVVPVKVIQDRVNTP